MTRPTDSGFTLIETLVALAVLGTSSVALLGATQAHIARIADLETRAAAQWTAENMLAELTLGLAPNAAPDPVLGIKFGLAATNTPTEEPDLDRVDIVATNKEDGRVYGRLTGFLDTGVSND